MIERLANVFGKVGFHGAIGIVPVGTIAFVCIYGVMSDPEEGSVLADLTTMAFTTLVVAAGGLLTGAVAVFRQFGAESDKPVEKLPEFRPVERPPTPPA